jgi:hypothetical protein
MSETKSLRATLFRPTTSLSGNEYPSVFRGENLVLRGPSDNPYFEVFGGNLDLDEDYALADFALTGTVSCYVNSTTVGGSGTLFRTELHLGQHILIDQYVLAVKEILSDEYFICSRAPTGSASGTGYGLPQLSELNGKRCVMMSGNAIEFGKGHLIAVGSGEMFVNGEPLEGESLIASSRAQAAIYRPATDDYVVAPLGFDTVPPVPEVTMTTGGTKGMVVGNKHSFMVSYWTGSPEGTDGYSNPSPVVKKAPDASLLQITSTNNRFSFDFTPSLVDMPAHAQGFIIWGSQAGKKSKSTAGDTFTVTSPNETLYENGPWYKVAEILTDDLEAGDTYVLEYLDTEIGEEVTGGNYPPPGGEFVVKIDGRPVIVSCLGKATTEDGGGSNPGPSCVVGKFSNPDGFPLEWSASVGGTIIGTFEGVGRWFMSTPNALEFIVSTGLYGQQTEGGRTVDLPIISRPYWKTGASNRYSILLVDDTLYGRSGGRFFKSVGYGDENVKKYDFGSVVDDITRDWNDGYVFAANDPKNTQIVFVHTAAYKNDEGYWVSELLPYSLFNDAWLPKVVLSSPNADMIVSGVATVDEKLEFLCGGRGGFKTYRFGAGDTALTAMPYYLIWQISDDGMENQSKAIKAVRPSGKFTDMVVQVHGAKPGQQISVTNMEDGAATESGAYFSGDIAFADTTAPTRYLERKVKIRDLAVYALRISGEWDGTGIKDRLEELVVEMETHGRSR